ncbi:hypothetical protein PVAP13_7KG236155 [Panicum virgatum]|uniref:Uncharacterized protein n=1 Tax=Panicum virgatum TaxID=38727 RepID=A0A8T0QNW3_PANVG|nr:hypothetical protein PVAP13_7KG236155 [Panicum virgatum]
MLRCTHSPAFTTVLHAKLQTFSGSSRRNGGGGRRKISRSKTSGGTKRAGSWQRKENFRGRIKNKKRPPSLAPCCGSPRQRASIIGDRITVDTEEGLTPRWGGVARRRFPRRCSWIRSRRPRAVAHPSCCWPAAAAAHRNAGAIRRGRAGRDDGARRLPVRSYPTRPTQRRVATRFFKPDELRGLVAGSEEGGSPADGTSSDAAAASERTARARYGLDETRPRGVGAEKAAGSLCSILACMRGCTGGTLRRRRGPRSPGRNLSGPNSSCLLLLAMPPPASGTRIAPLSVGRPQARLLPPWSTCDPSAARVPRVKSPRRRNAHFRTRVAGQTWRPPAGRGDRRGGRGRACPVRRRARPSARATGERAVPFHGEPGSYGPIRPRPAAGALGWWFRRW